MVEYLEKFKTAGVVVALCSHPHPSTKQPAFVVR